MYKKHDGLVLCGCVVNKCLWWFETQVLVQALIAFRVLLTFCDFSATMRTNSKSYIPSATSYIWLTSTRKRTYLRASSDVTHSASDECTGLAEINKNIKLSTAFSWQANKEMFLWTAFLFSSQGFSLILIICESSSFVKPKRAGISFQKEQIKTGFVLPEYIVTMSK